MKIAKYLSKIDGITEIGSEDYDIPIGKRGACVSPNRSYITVSPVSEYNDISYYGIDFPYLLSIRHSYTDFDTYYHYLSYADLTSSYDSGYRKYLGSDFSFPYALHKENCSPEWTEWLDYNIPYSVGAPEVHGLFNIYWFNPIEQKYEKGVYIRENENKTEVYVVFYEIYNIMVNIIKITVPHDGTIEDILWELIG